MDKQREAFEAWYGKNYQVDARKFWTDVCRCYSNPVVALAWMAWQAAIASQWQPIETAPKDGTTIIAVVHGFRPTKAQFHDAFGWWIIDGDRPSDDWFCGGMTYDPTHWMPLPPEPAK